MAQGTDRSLIGQFLAELIRGRRAWKEFAHNLLLGLHPYCPPTLKALDNQTRIVRKWRRGPLRCTRENWAPIGTLTRTTPEQIGALALAREGDTPLLQAVLYDRADRIESARQHPAHADEGPKAQERASDPQLDAVGNFTIAEHLEYLGVERHAVYEGMGIFDVQPNRVCIGHTILLQNLNGLAPALVRATAYKCYADLPPFLRARWPDARRDLRGEHDHPKGALVRWHQVSDDVMDERLDLDIELSRYSIKKAMMDYCRAEIESDLVSHRLRLFHDNVLYDHDPPRLRLHSNFHCDATIITSDRKIILSQRGKADSLHLRWMASSGESMDYVKDKFRSYHPLTTMWRGIGEEVNFAEPETQLSARVRFTGLFYSLANFSEILHAIVEVDARSKKVLEEAAKRHDPEVRGHSCMDFSPEACACAVAYGEVNGMQLDDSARAYILVAALHEFEREFTAQLALLSAGRTEARRSP